jgi:tetratricopeptide (TPR) repeat protein
MKNHPGSIKIMKTKSLIVSVCIIIVLLFSKGKLYSQEFKVIKVTDKVSIVSNPDLGSQVVAQTQKGLVVFDSFESKKTAKIFKKEISKTLGRDDFSYVINMVDRLDMIGGNDAYQQAVISGHENILTKYSSEKIVKKEIIELIEMWREKAGYARDRLKNLKEGSQKALEEESWIKKCTETANELEKSFSLVLPTISYTDKMALDLGNCQINLFWFGSAGNYNGLTMAVIPEEKLAVISKEIVYPDYHLAPYPFPYYGNLDVPRWIAMLEMILEQNPVEKIILSDSYEVYSREHLHSHLKYIRKLWKSVKALEAEGKTLPQIQDQLSLEKDFAFVKEMQAYKNTGDDWIRPQHQMHLRLFFLQGRVLASEIIKDGRIESLRVSLNKIKSRGSDIYFDEISTDFLGFEWMNNGKINEAIEVYKLNVETFPLSSNAYNSLADAYTKKGDTENAIKNYKKSLELNPNNNNAQEMLKKLSEK